MGCKRGAAAEQDFSQWDELTINRSSNGGEEMNPKEMTLEQLKSLAYDLIVQLEQTRQNLSIINAEIQEKSKPGPITEVKGE